MVKNGPDGWIDMKYKQRMTQDEINFTCSLILIFGLMLIKMALRIP